MELTMVLLATIGNIIALLLTPFPDSAAEQIKNVQVSNKVKITVFYESLCPDSRRFIVNQLLPTFQELGDIMDIELYAYGKATTKPRVGGEGYVFRCQHGSRECDGNKVLECGKKYIPAIETYLPYTACIMGSRSPHLAGEECAKQVGVEDWRRITDCAGGVEGEILHKDAGEIQQKTSPNLYYVPWILIDEIFDMRLLRAAESNLKEVVCRAYQGETPIQCQ